jgi:two-component system, cell cycle sensor histidine kinase and response regulator CckA
VKAPRGRGHETATVLVVDDDDAVRAVICRALEETGLRVLKAGSAAEALAAAADVQIDLLVADVSMPDMGGPALTARLHAEQPALRVIYVSGWLDRSAFPELGDAPLLTKPFTLEELRRAVAHALGDGPRVRPE